jgi:glycosyltransferase involved in cell wall biosynthesis
MKISGYTYVRGGIDMDYPFLESIRSVLPICDEMIVAVGEVNDGTREAVESIGSDKIKIIDTVWDMSMREGGKVIAQQANIAMKACTGDWLFHIQADEVMHERDLPQILEAVRKAEADARIEGLLFPWLHFWGGYRHVRTSRKAYRHEIRLFRNHLNVFAYRDAQGVRVYPSEQAYLSGHAGRKLRVKLCPTPVYHYGYVRPPEGMKKKADFFHRFWHDDAWLEKNLEATAHFKYEAVDQVEEFIGSHPSVMRERVEGQFWTFHPEQHKTASSLRVRLLNRLEKMSGRRFGEYKNYQLLD